MATPSQKHYLLDLPQELLCEILDRVPLESLEKFCLVSKVAYQQASVFLWKSVSLYDRCGVHSLPPKVADEETRAWEFEKATCKYEIQ
jgi:F-box-like